MIPYGKHQITTSDYKAVEEVLSSKFLTQGEQVPAFEKALAKVTKAPYVTAVSSGTAALHLAYKAMGLKPGQRVLVPAITFSATANAAVYENAIPVFVDIDPKNFCMDLDLLESILESAPKGHYAGVTMVHMAGYPADMKRLKAIAEKYELWVVEDACHAIGATRTYDDGKTVTGDCQYSDVAIFSFHPVKHVACGEGGAITTQSEEIYKNVSRLRTHGITKDPEQVGELEPWEYDMLDLGLNYRMTDIQAALGLSQIQRFEENIEKRRELAKKYQSKLQGTAYTLPSWEDEDIQHAFHLYIIQTVKRRELYDFLRERNIFSQVHYRPVYQLKYYRDNFPAMECPNAEAYYSKCLSLPMFPSLEEDEFKFVIESLNKFGEKL